MLLIPFATRPELHGTLKLIAEASVACVLRALQKSVYPLTDQVNGFLSGGADQMRKHGIVSAATPENSGQRNNSAELSAVSSFHPINFWNQSPAIEGGFNVTFCNEVN